MHAWMTSKTLQAGLLLALPGLAQAAEYKLEPSSSMIVHLYKSGIAARLAHEHAVQATQFSGTIQHDPAAPAASSIQVDAKAAGLVLDDPAARAKIGIEGTTPEKDRKEAAEHMVGEDQLDVKKFPSLGFKSTSITRQEDGSFLVKGKVTIHGVTQEVSFPAKVDVQGQTFHAKGQFNFLQSKFGYSPFSTLMGAIKVADEATMLLDLTGTELVPPPAAAPAPEAAPAAAATPAPAAAPAKK